MKAKKNRLKIYFTSLIILFVSVACNNAKPEQVAKEIPESKQVKVIVETTSEAIIDSLIENLSGIEYYFVKHRDVSKNKKEVYNNLLALLKYKNDPNYTKLKNNETEQYKILQLDTKSGYLIMESTPENINYFAFWNLNDGTENKILAEVSRGCGPQCTDDIYFYKIIKSNSKNSKYKFENLKPNSVIENYAKIPEVLVGHKIDDYYPISINLPQNGKNITMCLSTGINLNINDDDTMERKGNCIELLWNATSGTFTHKE